MAVKMIPEMFSRRLGRGSVTVKDVSDRDVRALKSDCWPF